jgi:hypothetical protein
MASLTFALRLKRAFFKLAGWLKKTVAFVFRLAELTWRCAYPAAASAGLLVFFVGLSQGKELLKIFISGERTAFEYYALPAAFALASLIFLLVARCILQRRWESVFSRGEVDRVSPIWVNALPFFIAVAPLLGLAWVCYGILGELREVSAQFCAIPLPSAAHCELPKASCRSGSRFCWLRFLLCLRLGLARARGRVS